MPIPYIGSPPRAWGQLLQIIHIAASIRFTPTRVGTTESAPPPTEGVTVHPHARGDNL